MFTLAAPRSLRQGAAHHNRLLTGRRRRAAFEQRAFAKRRIQISAPAAPTEIVEGESRFNGIYGR